MRKYLYRCEDGSMRWHDQPSPRKVSQPQWPLPSYAMGVVPEAVPEHQAHCKRMGIPTEFQPDGAMVFTGPGHRKKVLQAYNMVDRETFSGRG